jgi:hypothetical protein
MFFTVSVIQRGVEVYIGRAHIHKGLGLIEDLQGMDQASTEFSIHAHSFQYSTAWGGISRSWGSHSITSHICTT